MISAGRRVADRVLSRTCAAQAPRARDEPGEARDAEGRTAKPMSAPAAPATSHTPISVQRPGASRAGRAVSWRAVLAEFQDGRGEEDQRGQDPDGDGEDRLARTGSATAPRPSTQRYPMSVAQEYALEAADFGAVPVATMSPGSRVIVRDSQARLSAPKIMSLVVPSWTASVDRCGPRGPRGRLLVGVTS